MDKTMEHIAVSVLQQISSEQAHHYRIVPIQIKDEILVCVTDASAHGSLEKELTIILGKSVKLELTSKDVIDVLLATHYRLSASNQKEQFIYTTDFLEQILITAKQIGSSDIHFEPYEAHCRIRYRLDGKLLEQFQIATDEYPIIANKIKIKGGLDIAERRLPQDGRITVTTSDGEFDIRVSTMPTLHGEKIVLRLLSKDAGKLVLNDLGFTSNELAVYKECIKKPNGMVLISGPTGSGKTTTLYATLKLLNDSATNIVTIEDPIEYTLEGVNQVQLKENIGLDFTSALRTFLRQDPDVIMVGEIRDVKTANMAIRASLTGHLVLSTIHTNSAWATISRLIDMGVPPFLIASTLNVSVAQRLVRILCDDCKEEGKLDTIELPATFKNTTLKHHYKEVGCSSCHYTGYSGRKAIYEIIPITKELVDYIKNNDHTIAAYLEKYKIPSLQDNALQLVKEGVTSIKEVYPLLLES